MDRAFDYEGAKRLCASHKQILDTIRRTYASREKDEERVWKEAKEVFGSQVIATEIAVALQVANINVAMQPNERALIRELYVCEEGRKVVSVLGNMDQLRREIVRNMNTLDGMSSSLKWLFSGKQTKEAANAAYQRLSQLMQGEYPSLIRSQEERSRELDSMSVNDAYGAVSGHEQSYMQCLMRCAANLVKQVKPLPEISQKIKQVNDVVSQYQGAQKNQQSREQQARDTVDNAINSLIMEQTLEELRKQDIDVLAQRRSGIRLKALRDRGYRNMADLYAASLYQLASVYGISQDAARVIKNATNEIAQEVAKTIKLKISSDERTSAATAVLKAVYKYDRIKKASQVISPEFRKRLDESGQHTACLSSLNNNLYWVLANPAQKQRYISAYQALSSGLNPALINAVQTYNRDVLMDMAIPDSQVWSDFASRSVEYFNILEELRPGAFGNDDLLYGLPEDLAREIQEQVYFPQGLKVTLRKYQEWGVKYILHQGRVLLGDEMGLGKTVQAIATMVSLRNTGAKKFLVVCPASVLPNWCKEIDRKSEFRSIMVHGNGRQAAFDSWNQNDGVAVTTYETLGTLTIPVGLSYDLLVVDEAHFIKNENALRSQYVRLYGNYTRRLLYMTGTALENKVEEMLSLLQVLNPRVAAQAKPIAFMSTAPQFRQVIAPVYYRRKRDDVLTELPAIAYSKEWCDLLQEEYAAYKQAVLAKDRTSIRRVSWVMEDPGKSAKIRRLKEIVEEAESDGRKILVFSFYLDTIECVIDSLGRRCTQPINGSVPVQRRQQIIDEFEKMPAGSVLPAQIQAGGTGLNIQSASVVIICEPQLKPSIENQAISRAYRMGQTRKVLVYRLLASNTIDERIDDILTEKQVIFDAFADISEAVTAKEKEDYQIDEMTFGKLIQEEIDRINAGKDYVSPQQTQKQSEPVRTQSASQRPTSTIQSAPVHQSQARQTPPSPSQPKPAASAAYPQMTRKSDTGAYKSEPMIGAAKGVRSSGETSSAYKGKPMLNVPTAREEPLRTIPRKQETVSRFTRLEDFLQFVQGNGIMVKDNRGKGGCVWVKADPRVDAVIQKQPFGDHKFKYSQKSKALGGEPGWYY